MTSHNGTTLTREALLNKAKLRFDWYDIEGLGRVGIRTQSELQRSIRATNYNDNNKHLWRIWQIVDQVMVDEKTPMFDDSQAEMLYDLDPSVLDRIMVAINQHNGDSEKKDSTESTESRKP